MEVDWRVSDFRLKDSRVRGLEVRDSRVRGLGLKDSGEGFAVFGGLNVME